MLSLCYDASKYEHYAKLDLMGKKKLLSCFLCQGNGIFILYFKTFALATSTYIIYCKYSQWPNQVETKYQAQFGFDLAFFEPIIKHVGA